MTRAFVADGIECLPKEARPPKPVMLQLIGEVLQNYEYRHELYRRAIAELAGFYNRHGFKMMVLKGYACAMDWPKPEHRPSGDIDIWLFGEQKEADAVLVNTDFTNRTDEWSPEGSVKNLPKNRIEIDNSHHHHTVFYWRDFMVENHYDFINVHHHRSNTAFERILKAKRSRLHYHSYKGEVGKVAPNVLERDFAISGPNQKWTTDVTQVNIHDKKLYLSPILDMYNGEIISYSISYSPGMNMVMAMLDKAFKKVKDTKGMILHSDQGWQYQHKKYQQSLKNHGIIQSMSRKGNCLDNSMMENFFGLMKTELLYLHDWSSIEEFEKELRSYISYYNHDRIKLRLNGKSPVQYRTLYQ